MNKKIGVLLIPLILLTAASLVVNLLVANTLWQIREVLLNTTTQARAIFAGMEDDTLTYTVEIHEDILVSTSVPFNKQITVPINTTIPVDTTVVVPIDAGILGTFDVDVPIRSVIPIDMDINAPISETVDVFLTVPVDLEVPVEIPLSETSFGDALQALDQALAELEAYLAQPMRGGGTEIEVSE